MTERHISCTNGATPAIFLGAIDVRREVWRSLVSLLRVYASAARLNGKSIAVIEPSFGILLLQHKDIKLELSLNFESGAASCRLTSRNSPESSRGFELSDMGILRLGGEEKPLDEAAIEWVEELAGVKAPRQVS